MSTESINGAGSFEGAEHPPVPASLSLFHFTAHDIDGNARPLEEFRGKVTLVVNTASECGFTPQYEGLQSLQDQFADRGFSVLGFPCNQFGGQEPGHNHDIAEFCTSRFNVTFPMFAKVDVNGEAAHPVYRWLTTQQRGLLGGRITWNFTKFLVGRDGQVIRRFAPPIPPARLARAIDAALSR